MTTIANTVEADLSLASVMDAMLSCKPFLDRLPAGMVGLEMGIQDENP